MFRILTLTSNDAPRRRRQNAARASGRESDRRAARRDRARKRARRAAAGPRAFDGYSFSVKGRTRRAGWPSLFPPSVARVRHASLLRAPPCCRGWDIAVGVASSLARTLPPLTRRATTTASSRRVERQPGRANVNLDRVNAIAISYDDDDEGDDDRERQAQAEAARVAYATPLPPEPFEVRALS